MSETRPYEPEVGQMLFGNATGSYAPGELGEACLQHALNEIERVFWNREQRQWDRHEDPAIPQITFRPYYWGDCDCGGEQRLAAWTEEHAPSCYQTEYYALPESMRHSYDGPEYVERQRIVRAICERRGIPWNDGYGCAVHCDCGHDERWRTFARQNGCTPQCATVLPNFAFGDVEIRWYKHSRRGLSVNRPLTADEWRAWLNEVMAAIRSADPAIL